MRKSIQDLAQTREEYGDRPLVETEMSPDPFVQFTLWFDQYAQLDPNTCNAMVLSTVDTDHHPDARVVLLKELLAGEFIFYTHYTSEKGIQMTNNPHVALTFYWSSQARQIRVRGCVRRLSAEQSDAYFHMRPRASQLSCLISHQSEPIANRAELEIAYQQVCRDNQDKEIVRPDYWGGYAVMPSQIEFWQGRNSRLHDRIRYTRQDTSWHMQRLAP